MFTGWFACALALPPTPPPFHENPLTSIIPAHTPNFRVSPIIPAHTKTPGVGGTRVHRSVLHRLPRIPPYFHPFAARTQKTPGCVPLPILHSWAGRCNRPNRPRFRSLVASRSGPLPLPVFFSISRTPLQPCTGFSMPCALRTEIHRGEGV